ncbi:MULTISPECIES: DUF3613 domain-containing protein [unclassified Burkholderia]|uniref:DUF3613 domain-containing protein n=1 Tax=unclassified Burkholderia TaxID=2613784 RepID=UPI00084BD314|nr:MULTISPECIES: DUF3613 domain-containing protein [unclassified Burkholderia]OED08647.1 hypothetical protein A9Z05_05920 [Burkholderia sp. A2]OXI73162.1 hypothetical protein CFB81_07430 [Burkholderia sp. AU28863]RQU16338.1 DUF3613 domain-containing protein [Burkholderia cenocepacia]RQU20950.1 DUF3613 domain-containing protein [Burkholderia cenocepacia]
MNRHSGNDMSDNTRNRSACAGRIAMLVAIICIVTDSGTAYGQDAVILGASDVGRSTKDWLAMQRDNRAAAPTQPVFGDVASLAYQRYLDSFKNKIPDSMSSQLGAVGGMSGGGQGGQ